MSPKILNKQSLLIILLVFAVALVVADHYGMLQSHGRTHNLSSQKYEIPGAASDDSAALLLGAPQPEATPSDQTNSPMSREERLALLKSELAQEQARLDAARQDIFDLQNVLDVPEEAAGWDPDRALLKPGLQKYAAYFKARKVYEQSEQNRRSLYLKILSESRDKDRAPQGSPPSEPTSPTNSDSSQ